MIICMVLGLRVENTTPELSLVRFAHIRIAIKAIGNVKRGCGVALNFIGLCKCYTSVTGNDKLVCELFSGIVKDINNTWYLSPWIAIVDSLFLNDAINLPLSLVSGNSLVPDSTKPLAEPLRVYDYKNRWGDVASIVLISVVNTLRPRQNGRHFANDIFKCIFLNQNALISLKISLKFVPKVRINNIPTLVQIMAWRRPGDKPLPEPMMVSLLTHICVTRPQWVKECLKIALLMTLTYPTIKVVHRSSGFRSFRCMWVRSWRCGCIVTWFCYQSIAKPGNKAAAPPWPAYVTYVIFLLLLPHQLTTGAT